jgi:hypothetical protein
MDVKGTCCLGIIVWGALRTGTFKKGDRCYPLRRIRARPVGNRKSAAESMNQSKNKRNLCEIVNN